MRELLPGARWIWCAGEERPKNFYLFGRKVFSLPHKIRRAWIRITADSRYRLWLNGTAVARGPARCDPRWQCLDEWEVTGALKQGTNVLAVLVHHYGEWTFSYILGRGGLLAELTIEAEDGSLVRIATDDAWKVMPAPPWERELPRMSIQLGYPEVYDARREIAGWREAAFDDSAWERATVLGPPTMPPWIRLVPREIPAMSEEPRAAERVLETGELGSATLGHYVDLMRVAWSTSNAVAYLATFVWSPVETPIEIHAGSQDAIRLWLNNTELIAHLVARDPGPDQEVVRARLRAGWNTILAKVVQGEGQWHFYFRLDGERSAELLYARSPRGGPPESEEAEVWNFLGPFPCRDLAEGFATTYGPEEDLDLNRSYRRTDDTMLGWISAGVSRESLLTSVVMGRESRFPERTACVENPGGLLAGSPRAVFRPGAEHGTYAVLDFGREMTGYVAIEIEGALGGETIDLGYAEALETPTGELVSPASGMRGVVNPDRAAVHNADRYICREGTQRFQTFDKRAFRYLQIDVRNLRQKISIGPVSLVFSSYPVEYRGSFACSDNLLNRIWEVGRWTAQLNMEDAYSDSPWRERAQWWGDVRVEALVSYYAFGDGRLVRQGLRHIAQSQRSDGLTMGIYPTSWPGGLLPTYTLLWVISLRDYALYTGDRALLAEIFPAAERAMAFFEPLLSERGLLAELPHWLFVDWAPVVTDGESAAVNALYLGALGASAQMAAELGKPDRERSYRDRADRVRQAMRQNLWDPNRTCFREAPLDDRLEPRFSEQANCWAIVFGAAPEESSPAILRKLLAEGGADVRIGTPYFAFYLLQAFAAAGEHGEALAYIRSRWGAMLDWGATSWWESWEPKASLCHGWSAGPTSFLLSDILGAQPATSGWEEILIEPHPAGLAWAKGVVPTPRGELRIEWEVDEKLLIRVRTPAPCTVRLPPEWSRVSRIAGARNCEIPGAVKLAEPGSYALECMR